MTSSAKVDILPIITPLFQWHIKRLKFYMQVCFLILIITKLYRSDDAIITVETLKSGLGATFEGLAATKLKIETFGT